MKSHHNIIIVGGGIVGCSTAYHLAKMGIKDVLVLEKGELTSGSTWHAAGLVGQLRTNRNITRMLKYSVELYEKLEAETGQPTGWCKSGGLRLACTPERMQEIKKVATTAKSFGLDMEIIGPKEAKELFPIMSDKDVLGACYLPTDGYTDPSMTTNAMAAGAKQNGVTFKRGIRVLDLKLDGKSERVTEVITDNGVFTCDTFLNAAGMWARELGQMAGVNVPLIPVEHQYLVTEVISDLPKNLPTMRDPDHLIYYKEEAGGLVMGGYEPNPIPWSVKGISKNFGQELLESRFDHFEQLAELAIKRTPVLGEVGVRKLINGPEAFTPDGHFIMGKAPELKNYFVAAGFNAHGIAAGGGAGKMMAEWIVEGHPSLDLWPVDIRRFGSYSENIKYVENRTLELYGKHYTISWPHEEHDSARDIKKGPLYEILKKKGAVYGTKFGWERPNWFAPNGVEPKDTVSFDRPNWFEHVAKEHMAIRNSVALIDQSSFSKMEVEGPDALKFLQMMAVNDVDKPIGSLVYTQFCNERGGIEADLTIGRIAEDKFYIVTGTAFGEHDKAWLDDNLPQDFNLTIKDITPSRGVINICGPKSLDVLKKVSSADFSLEKFPFATLQNIEVGLVETYALRVTYVGELGWELHVPSYYAQTLYNTLWEAGQEFGIINAGYRAIESCRLEKGYRYWSTDLTPDYTPYAAGLGFCVKLDKENFVGKEALINEKEKGPAERLVAFTLEEDPCLHGGETIICQDKVIGVLTSGGYGHYVKKTLAYGYIPREYLKAEEFFIESFGKKVKAKRFKGSLYDPKRQKIMV